MRGRSKFGWHYPPGAANDPSAPWNQPEPPECPECGSLVADPEDHGEDCSLDGLDASDLLDRETPGRDEADRREL